MCRWRVGRAHQDLYGQFIAGIIYIPMVGAGHGLRRFAASSITGRAGKKRGSRARYVAAVLGTAAAMCGGGYYWRADRRERRQMRLVIEGLGRFAR